MRWLFFFLLALLCFQCITPKPTISEVAPPAPKLIVLKNLMCHNLSESMMGFGTIDDETLLLVYFLDKNFTILDQWQSKYIPFSEEKDMFYINDTIDIPRATDALLAVLIEQDTERDENTLEQLTRQHIVWEKLPFINKLQMQSALKDDDYLDAYFLKKEDFSTTQQLDFWGMQLFDEFEYALNIQFHFN